MIDADCYVCEIQAEEKHHIVAKQYGGGNGPENIAPLCKHHHDLLDRFHGNLGSMQEMFTMVADGGKEARFFLLLAIKAMGAFNHIRITHGLEKK